MTKMMTRKNGPGELLAMTVWSSTGTQSSLAKARLLLRLIKGWTAPTFWKRRGKFWVLIWLSARMTKSFARRIYTYIYIYGNQEQEIKFQANVSEALCNGVFASDNNTDGVLAREVKKKALNCFSRLWFFCSSFSRQRCCLWIWSIVREGSKRAASTQHQTSPRPCFGLVTRCTGWLCNVLLNNEDLDNKTYFQELVHFTSECTNMTLPDCFCWSTVREVRRNFQSRCMNSSGGWKRKSLQYTKRLREIKYSWVRMYDCIKYASRGVNKA